MVTLSSSSPALLRGPPLSILPTSAPPSILISSFPLPVIICSRTIVCVPVFVPFVPITVTVSLPFPCKNTPYTSAPSLISTVFFPKPFMPCSTFVPSPSTFIPSSPSPK